MQDSSYRKLNFALVDVFAGEPLRGNPLAVVDDGTELDDEAMRRLALEFNQAETTFILPPTRPAADHRLRSFTATGTEVFGAGHNALGAWWRLAAMGRLGPLPDTALFHQEIGDETLPVTVRSRDVWGSRVECGEALAAALGLQAGDLAPDRVPAQVVSTGTHHLMVPVTDRAAVDRADPNAPELRRQLVRAGAEGCYIFSLDPTAEGAAAYSRFFNPVAGIREDPATGTAAGPLASHLVAHRLARDGSTVLIQQGVVMGRESLLQVFVAGEHVALSGSCFTASEGVILV